MRDLPPQRWRPGGPTLVNAVGRPAVALVLMFLAGLLTYHVLPSWAGALLLVLAWLTLVTLCMGGPGILHSCLGNLALVTTTAFALGGALYLAKAVTYHRLAEPVMCTVESVGEPTTVTVYELRGRPVHGVSVSVRWDCGGVLVVGGVATSGPAYDEGDEFLLAFDPSGQLDLFPAERAMNRGVPLTVSLVGFGALAVVRAATSTARQPFPSTSPVGRPERRTPERENPAGWNLDEEPELPYRRSRPDFRRDPLPPIYIEGPQKHSSPDLPDSDVSDPD
jgi:hypothetical protein